MQHGLYGNHLASFVQTFGRKNVHVIFFEDFKKSTASEICNLMKQLEISTTFYQDFTFDIKNKTFAGRNKDLHKIALLMNKRLERFWLNHPRIKSIALNSTKVSIKTPKNQWRYPDIPVTDCGTITDQAMRSLKILPENCRQTGIVSAAESI